jgi:hypothetical protein
MDILAAEVVVDLYIVNHHRQRTVVERELRIQHTHQQMPNQEFNILVVVVVAIGMVVVPAVMAVLAEAV